MKRVFLFVAVTLALGVWMVAAQEGIAGTYTDPDGRYSIPIPTNWTAEPTESGAALLTDPDRLLLAYALVVESDDAAAAIATAWAQIGVTIEAEPDRLDVPSAPGIDQTVVINYQSTDTPIYQGFAQRIGGNTYILLFVVNDLAAAQQRAAQIQIIASGFLPAELQKVDLSAAEPLAVDETVIAELEAFIEANLPVSEVPGVAVAIVQGGEIVYANGFGVRDLATGAPMDAETRMMIGSVTKSMTTLMMATLVDDGALTWDTPVVEVLPEFAVADPALTETITVRNLVCACTGVPRRDLEFLFNAAELTGEDTVESLATFRFFTDFGEAFQYSNQMVAAGGYAAAAAAGGAFGTLEADYSAAMSARVFDPIGMTRTTFDFDTVLADDNAATPYSAVVDETGAYYEAIPTELEAILLPIAPAGAVWSSANDMARYLLTLLGDGVNPEGETVVSAENLALTWQPQIAVNANVSYGLGWFIGDYRGAPIIYHGGNTLGFTADVAFLPGKDLGIVVLANGQGANALTEAIRMRLLELVFEIEPSEAQAGFDFLVEQAEAVEPELIASIGAADPDAAAALVGEYASQTLGELTLTLDAGVLLADAGEFASELRPYTAPDADPNTWIMLDAPATGTVLAFDPDAGTLTIDIETDQYTFTRAG